MLINIHNPLIIIIITITTCFFLTSDGSHTINQTTQKLILYGSVYGIQKKHSNLSDIHSNKTKTNHYISPGKYRVGTWKNKIKKTSNQPTWKKNPLVVIGASV